MEKKPYLYYAGLILVAAAWGANFGIIRQAMDTFPPALFTFLRFGLSVPIFFILLKLTEGSIGVSLKAAFQLMVLGLIGITVLEITVMYSIKFTTLANSSLLNVAPWPIFAALFSPLFMRESVSRRLVVGGIAAMIGVSMVIIGGSGGLDFSSKNMLGNILALSVSILGALYNLACMPLMKQYSALRVSAWTILFGSLFLLPLTLSSWGNVHWSAMSLSAGLSLGYNVIICTVVGFIVWNFSMFRIGATRSNFFRYVVPVAAVTAGYFMFGETITAWQVAGGLCMAAGLIWISMEKKAPPVTTTVPVQSSYVRANTIE
ncbi:MAG: rane protein [Paenibacillus sp.]|jgi:drug/metabolite transporter (DMT)-like permease|nr:rane protein [Paenibacillus sp.]